MSKKTPKLTAFRIVDAGSSHPRYRVMGEPWTQYNPKEPIFLDPKETVLINRDVHGPQWDEPLRYVILNIGDAKIRVTSWCYSRLQATHRIRDERTLNPGEFFRHLSEVDLAHGDVFLTLSRIRGYMVKPTLEDLR